MGGWKLHVKISKYNVQSKMERNSLFLLLWLVDITEQEEIPKGWFWSRSYIYHRYFFFWENNGYLLVYKKKWLDCWFIWKYSGTPLIWSLMGQNKLAKLMDDRINEGFFTRKCIAVLPGSQKRGQITKWPYCCITAVAIRQGFTVLHGL